MSHVIESNVQKITDSIRRACVASNRDVSAVQPIVVTKNRSIEEIQTMYRLGFRHFAENRVEKLLERQAAFTHQDIVWHLIGPLQKRKVKSIINAIHYFHAVDRLSILEEIEKRAQQPINCFVEVNVSGEETKHGFTVQDCMEYFGKMNEYPNIRIVGLMTMAPFEASESELTSYFSSLATLKKVIEERYSLKQELLLSMGMSNDYEIAIQSGATHIRIGTAWFE